MTIYYILMVLIFALAVPTCFYKPTPLKKGIYIGVILLYMLFMASFRLGIGNDYYHYRTIFYYISDGLLTIDRLYDAVEPGYLVFMKLSGMISNDYSFFNALTAIVILVPIAYVIWKYSKLPWMSFWLYLSLTFFYNSMNFTRQCISVSIILLAYGFMEKRKHWAVVLIILAASLFHTTALVLIPIYFLSMIKPTWKVLAGLSAAGILVFIFSGAILEFMFTHVLERYAKYADTLFVNNGLSPIYIVAPAIMFVITAAAWFTGWEKNCPMAGMFTNFAFYSLFIWIFVSKHFIVERFSMPVFMFVLISIPEVLVHFKNYFAEFGRNRAHAGSHFKASEKSGTADGRAAVIARKGGAAAVAAVVIITGFVYNDYCVGRRVHGVFPYRSYLSALNDIPKYYDLKKDYVIGFSGLDLMTFLNTVGSGDYTMLITVQGNASGGMEKIHTSKLKKLGIKTDIDDLNGKSCIIMVSNGESLFEAVSVDTLQHQFELYDGKIEIDALSSGIYADNTSFIYMRDEAHPDMVMDYSSQTSGLNICVFDNETKKLVAAQGYNTSDRELEYAHTAAYIW